MKGQSKGIPKDHLKNLGDVFINGLSFETRRAFARKMRLGHFKIRPIFIFSLILSCFALDSSYAQEKAPLIPFRLQQKENLALSSEQIQEAVESALFQKTNQERKQASLSSLIVDTALKNVALRHSQDMLKRRYLSHISPEGKSPVDRIQSSVKTQYLSLGENLHTIQTVHGLRDPQAIAEQMMKDWMNSPPHSKNILGKQFALLAIGCASDGKAIYCTQLFGKK